MKNYKELETFIRSKQGWSSVAFIRECAKIIESIKNLDLRRQLAEHVLYHVAKAGIAPSDPDFRKIAKSIESSSGEKFTKGFKSLIGSKAKVDDTEKSIQKLFREYERDGYPLAMLATRAELHTGITTEPVSSPAATSGGAGAEVVAQASNQTSYNVMSQVMPPSGLAKTAELPTYDDILADFNRLDDQEEISAMELDKLKVQVQNFRGSSNQISILQNQLLFAQTRYDSLHSSKDLRPAVGGAGTDPIAPPGPSPKRTPYADYFDELSASVREYQALQSQDFTALSEAQQLEIATRLNILENNALKVIEGQPGAAIETVNTQEPKLNHLGHAKRVGEQLRGNNFPATRQVRGDGNCYFRSIIYSYLENALCADPESGQKLELIGKLKEKLENLIGRYGDAFDMDLNLLISKLGAIEANGDYSIVDLQTDMLDSSRPSFDHLLVRAARALTAEAMIENKENIEPFLSDQSFDEYITDTLSMKKDADGPAIEGNYLGKSLGINIHLQNITPDGHTQKIATDPIKGSAYFNVHLLRDDTHNDRVERRRDSGIAHFFILYDPEQKKNIDVNLGNSDAAAARQRR